MRRLKVGTAALRILLRLYPDPFRRAYSQEMEFDFRLRLQQTLENRGNGSAALFCCRTFCDLLRTAWAERRHSCLIPSAEAFWHRRRRPRPQGDSLMQSILADLRLGFRGLRKHPGFALAAVLTLALGIGANTAIFSVVHSVVLNPLPYRDPDRLVMVYRGAAEGPSETFSYLDFEDWQRESRSFEGLAGFYETDGTFSANEGDAEHLRGTAVTRRTFSLLGAEPLLGRGFLPEEDRQDGPRALVLSYGLWQNRYGADPSAIGQTVDYEGMRHTIVGVMPEGFYFPDPQTRFWTAARGNELLARVGIRQPERGLTFMLVMARLRGGLSLTTAQAELQSLAETIAQRNSMDPWRILLVPRRQAVVGDVSPLLWTLLASVAIVLLIACANVANLTLVRAASRRRETALRTALGASRRRLVRSLLTESALLGIAGGTAGLLVAYGLLDWLVAQSADLIPRSHEIELNSSVLVFTAGVSLASALLFGLVPALDSSRPRLQPLLQSGGREGAAGGKQVLQKGLVVCQVALAVILLSGAGLLLNSFLRLTSVPSGFRPDGLLTVQLSLPEDRYADAAAATGFYEQLTEKLAGLAGVRSASYSYSLPFGGSVFRQTIAVEGLQFPPDDRHWAATVIVGPHHFETLGIPLLEGRDFNRQDRADSPPVAIVNQTMAQRYWPKGEVVGKHFRRDGGVDGSVDDLRYFKGRPWITVVGVAADVRRDRFDETPAAEFYVPHAQLPWASMAMVLRTAGNPLDLIEPVRAQVRSLDPSLAIFGMDTMRQRMDRSVLPQRLRTSLWALFALLAGLLAVVGVYGVMAFGVSRRTQEIGLRMALGAPRRRVLQLVLGQGLRMAVLGALIGLLGALAANQALSSLLYQITSFDPLTYAIVTFLLLSVAALACYLPARRASRVNPLAALRCE